jgi:hypothetical protein
MYDDFHATKGEKAMRRKTVGVVLMCAAIIVAAGCRSAMIYNLKDIAIPNAMTHELTLNEVTKAIVAAGAKHGWAMQVVKPGSIVATLILRGHVAVVDIPYTTKSYSIIYKSSENLNYNKESNSIHSNYNAWIRNLHVSIQRNLGGSGRPND